MKLFFKYKENKPKFPLKSLGDIIIRNRHSFELKIKFFDRLSLHSSYITHFYIKKINNE